MFKNKEELEELIHSLKMKQAMELDLLKQRIQLTSENRKPLNLLRSTLHEIIGNQAVKSNLIDTALVLSTNYLIKKIAPNKPVNKLTRFLVSFLEFSFMKYTEKK